MNKAAKLANTPLYAFMKLNPGFNRSSTAPQGPHRLLVPIAHAQAFKKNLAMLPYSERVSFNDYIQERIPHYIDDEDQGTSLSPTRKSSVKILHTLYKVKPGENLASIAIKNHTTMRSLRLANHLTSNSLRTGMRLQIATEEATSVKISSKARTTKSKSIISQAYVIKKGDTFANIAKQFSVTSKDLANWNNMKLNLALIPGRKLTIKSTNSQIASATSSIRLISYTVKKGDSLSQISKKFNITNAELLKSNAAVLVKGLRTGQKLKLLVDNNQSAS